MTKVSRVIPWEIVFLSSFEHTPRIWIQRLTAAGNCLMIVTSFARRFCVRSSITTFAPTKTFMRVRS